METGSYDAALASQVRARVFDDVAALIREIEGNGVDSRTAVAAVADLLREGLDAEAIRRRLGLNVTQFPMVAE